MAISINPLTYVISIPQSDLTFVSGTLYDHDTNAFRLELKSWEDSEIGISHPKTHNHNTEITISGVTYARTIEILAPYSIEYEDGAYSVRLLGSNNNIFDIQNGILIQNQVQVIPGNSAGLQTVTVGSGVLPSDIVAIKNAIWAEILPGSFTGSQAGKLLTEAGLTAPQATQLLEIWRILGLDSANPLNIEQTQHTVGGVVLNVVCNPDNSVTITRQP